MTGIWIDDRLPTESDADLHGQVRWGIRHPGMLMHWSEVRPGEPWHHSAAFEAALAGGLVERVAQAIIYGMLSGDHQAARAAILAVAEWFDAIGYGATASILRQEVERG